MSCARAILGRRDHFALLVLPAMLVAVALAAPGRVDAAENDASPQPNANAAHSAAVASESRVAAKSGDVTESAVTESGATPAAVSTDADGDSDGDQGDTEPITEAVATEHTRIDLGKTPGKVTFTFQEAPWPDVLREFASWSGLSLDMTDTPPGYFNYFDSRQHTPTEAIDILNGYLLPRGHVAIRRDRFLVVIRTDNEMLSSMIPNIDLSELPDRGANELVRIVVPMQEISPELAAEEIQGVLGPHGSATPLPSSSSLVIQGFGSTLQQALQLLGQSKPLVTDDKLDFRAFPLQHLPALDAEQQIRVLFGLDARPGSTATNVSGARYEAMRAEYYQNRSNQSSSRDSKSREQNPPPVPLLQQVAMNMQVSALQRTNSLLVTATPQGLELVEEILQSIDQPVGDVAAEMQRDNEPFLRVYRIREADEGEVAKTLDALIPGVLVNEDSRHDTLHIMANSDQHDEVESLIAKLDFSSAGEQTLEVIPLRRSNPVAMQKMLTGMFIATDRDERPTIQSDLDTRTLIVRANPQQLAQIKSTLASYGESFADDDHGAAAGTGGRVRRIVARGRDAERVADRAAQLLNSDRSFENAIRVVVPGRQPLQETSTIRRPNESPLQQTGSGQPNPSQGEPDQSAPAVIRPEDVTQRGGEFFGQRPAVTLTRRNSSDASLATETPSVRKRIGGNNDSGTAASRPKVNIEARGDELYLYSGDTAALDQVEATVNELLLAMPQRTQWTVFYLRVADAAEVAARLYDLTLDLDAYAATDSLVYSPTETDQSLRIVADPRTNAIFVSGPADKVDQIEDFLDYLDTTEVPESLRDRKPHTILVQYADVNEVAEMLRGLYKDYLTDPAVEAQKAVAQARDDKRGGSLPPQAMPKSQGVRLALEVDPRTSELLVSCNDVLFQEIEAVVRQRDQAVRDSQPTVEVIPLSGRLPANVIEMLEGMSPNIKAEIFEPEQSNSSRSRSSSRK